MISVFLLQNVMLNSTFVIWFCGRKCSLFFFDISVMLFFLQYRSDSVHVFFSQLGVSYFSAWRLWRNCVGLIQQTRTVCDVFRHTDCWESHHAGAVKALALNSLRSVFSSFFMKAVSPLHMMHRHSSQRNMLEAWNDGSFSGKEDFGLQEL